MITISILIAAGFVGGYFIYQLCQNVFVGWCALLLVSLYNYAFGLNQQSVGGLHLSVGDFVVMSLLIAGIFRTLPRLRSNNSARALGMGFLILFFINYARGVGQFGLPAASNEARGYVGPLISLTYFLTASADDESLERYVKSYLLYGWGLVWIVILAYAGFQIGATQWSHATGPDASADGRFIPAAGACAVAFCFVFALGWVRARPAPLWIRISPPVFFVTAVLVRHRTVWMMLIAAVIMISLVDIRMFRRLTGMLLLSIVIAAIALSTSVVRQSTNAANLEESTQDEGTFLWRVNSWTELATQDQTPLSTLFGFSLGSGFWRFDPSQGVYTNLPPHSEYVAEYLRVGIVGLVFLLWYYLRPVRRLLGANKRRATDVFPTAGVWAIAIVMMLVYGVTYSMDLDALAIVAIAASVGDRVSTERTLTRRQNVMRHLPARISPTLQGN